MVNMQDLINQIVKNMQAAAKKYKIIQSLKEHEFVLDEDLVRFCGRCLFIQRIDRKPARKGLLFRVLAECETRYVLNTELFYGKAQENRSMLDLVRRMLLPFAFNDKNNTIIRKTEIH